MCESSFIVTSSKLQKLKNKLLFDRPRSPACSLSSTRERASKDLGREKWVGHMGVLAIVG